MKSAIPTTSRCRSRRKITCCCSSVLGFVLMAGGGSDSPDEFNYAMFSWRRITLAPILVIGGFAFEIYAILKRW